MDRDELIAAIREARQQSGLSQAAVAERAGISQPAWYYVERGQRTVSAETLVAMAAAVGIQVTHQPERFEAPEEFSKISKK